MTTVKGHRKVKSINGGKNWSIKIKKKKLIPVLQILRFNMNKTKVYHYDWRETLEEKT